MAPNLANTHQTECKTTCNGQVLCGSSTGNITIRLGVMDINQTTTQTVRCHSSLMCTAHQPPSNPTKAKWGVDHTKHGRCTSEHWPQIHQNLHTDTKRPHLQFHRATSNIPPMPNSHSNTDYNKTHILVEASTNTHH